MFQPQPIQVRRAPRKLPIEIGGLGKNGILTSFVYMPAEELQLSGSPCGKNIKNKLLGRAFHVSLELRELYEQNDCFCPSLLKSAFWLQQHRKKSFDRGVISTVPLANHLARQESPEFSMEVIHYLVILKITQPKMVCQDERD